MSFAPRAVYKLLIGWEHLTGFFTVGYSLLDGPDPIAPDQFSYSFVGDNDDMTVMVESATVTTGRADDLGPMRSGEGSFLLKDPEGMLNTANPSSPIVDSLSLPWRPVVLTATFETVTYPLYYGFTDRITFEPRGRSGYAQIEAFDLFSRLHDKPRLLLGETNAGEAIRRLLALIEFTDPARLALDIGDPIPGVSDQGDAEILEIIEGLMLATRGTFFIGPDGVAVHEDRATKLSREIEQTVSGVISDIAPGVDPSRIINKWTVTRTDLNGNVIGVPQTAADTSEFAAMLGERSDELTTPYLPDDSVALGLANYLVFITAQPVSSVYSTTIEGRTPELLHAILGTRLQRRVVVDEPESGTDLDGWVEQITHQIDAGKTHRTTWAISRRLHDYFFLDVSLLDGTDRLAL